MKKLYLLLIIISVFFQASAQDISQHIGVQLAYCQSMFREKFMGLGETSELQNYTLNGGKVGIVYDATLIKGFGFTLGVNYTFGAKVEKWEFQNAHIEEFDLDVRAKNYMHILEVPVDWQYKFEVAKDFYLILYTGPTIQVNIADYSRWYYRNEEGQISEVMRTNNLSDKRLFNLKEFIDNGYQNMGDCGAGDFAYNRLNVAWGIGVGLQYNRFYLRGGYDFGLINAYQKVVDGNRARQDQWQIKLGYYIWEL